MMNRKFRFNFSTESGLDVCLVNMPFCGVTRPSLALGLLQAALGQSQIRVRSLYANLLFAEKIGSEMYSFSEMAASNAGLGEWIFRLSAFPEFIPDDARYFSLLLKKSKYLKKYEPEKIRQKLIRLQREADQFVDQMAISVLSTGAKIVGCTSTFQQHVASLAILRKIRQYSPSTITLLGGANCETIMGKATHANFSWVDFVVSGEADGLIVSFCCDLLEKGIDLPEDEIPFGVFGPVHRLNGYPDKEKLQSFRATTTTLDDLPCPDYSDYFTFLQDLPDLSMHINPGLVFEASRGCWWGESHGCTFCGLNGAGKSYRRKQAKKVLKELNYLNQEYQITNFEASDNVLHLPLLTTLLPVLKLKKKYSLFFEVRANQQKKNIRMMSEAGIRWIQPGIESLHTQALNLMNKGCRAYHNIQLLKWSHLYGIRASWNLIYGFPDEEDSWYQEMAGFIPYFTHLQPPSDMIKLRFDRYSRYHEHHELYGLRLVPLESYQQIYPLKMDRLFDLVYFFEAENPRESENFTALDIILDQLGRHRLKKEITRWKAMFWHTSGPPVLQTVTRGRHIYLIDTRTPEMMRERCLTAIELGLLEICDAAVSGSFLSRKMSERGFAPGQTQACLEAMVAEGEIIHIDKRYLSLVTEKPHARLLSIENFPGGYLQSADGPLF